MAGLSSSDTSSLFFVFVFLGLASFAFGLASVVPFVSSFFFFGFYGFSLKDPKQIRGETRGRRTGDQRKDDKGLNKMKTGRHKK